VKHSASLALGACLLGASVGLVGPGIFAAGQPGARSTNDGVYSEEQASRGQSIFKSQCTACHDAARFTGEGFIKNWAGQPMADIFALVSTTMPEDNPGSLTPQQYADILSFFLRLNGFRHGDTELTGTADALKAVTIVPAPK
jgi:S-disulfanyl-L-cysteine oxidoreductase SoxD